MKIASILPIRPWKFIRPWNMTTAALFCAAWLVLYRVAAHHEWHLIPAFVTAVCCVLVVRLWAEDERDPSMFLLALWGLSPVPLAAWLWWALATR